MSEVLKTSLNKSLRTVGKAMLVLVVLFILASIAVMMDSSGSGSAGFALLAILWVMALLIFPVFPILVLINSNELRAKQSDTPDTMPRIFLRVASFWAVIIGVFIVLTLLMSYFLLQG